MNPKRPARGRKNFAASPEVLAVRPDVAWRMIDVSASTGWKLVRIGEIAVVRYGPNLTLVPLTSLRDFLARHAIATRPSEAGHPRAEAAA
jgi:hypothetical protein